MWRNGKNWMPLVTLSRLSNFLMFNFCGEWALDWALVRRKEIFQKKSLFFLFIIGRYHSTGSVLCYSFYNKPLHSWHWSNYSGRKNLLRLSCFFFVQSVLCVWWRVAEMTKFMIWFEIQYCIHTCVTCVVEFVIGPLLWKKSFEI